MKYLSDRYQKQLLVHFENARNTRISYKHQFIYWVCRTNISFMCPTEDLNGHLVSWNVNN